ncbi:hypothetical protein GCM10025864_35240 [Luteimicrobium album]|uniref:Succinyl-CoA synthetase-like flavodoxin domain-containing protein n=1 Tax=Luteimicrobium album TaxID=1054550 RepID=A0ABQ6I4R1_9MICO|nr:hypothetical protein GCM10025864_35240 [Luteimicrobium album]
MTLLATVRRRGLGVATFLSAGNRADVSGNDMMQFWSEDPSTAVACLSLESIGNPRKFSRIARRLASAKPVVVVAAGQSGHFAPPGHAVRRGHVPRRALEEIMRQAGVIRADNTHQMVDLAQLLAHQPLPAGRRVGIVGSSPSLVSAVADAAEAAGLVVACRASVEREDASPDRIRAALDVVFADGACDVVVAVNVPTVRVDLAWLAGSSRPVRRRRAGPRSSARSASTASPTPSRTPRPTASRTACPPTPPPRTPCGRPRPSPGTRAGARRTTAPTSPTPTPTVTVPARSSSPPPPDRCPPRTSRVCSPATA